MKPASPETIEVTVDRRIPASPGEVFDAWLDPSVPGAFGHEHEQLIVDLKPNGLWYWRSLGGVPHFGRFVEISRPGRLSHSWMSPNTRGQESMVVVTFEEADGATLMTIRHSGLPDRDMAAAHEKGWTSLADAFGASFAVEGSRH